MGKLRFVQKFRILRQGAVLHAVLGVKAVYAEIFRHGLKVIPGGEHPQGVDSVGSQNLQVLPHNRCVPVAPHPDACVGSPIIATDEHTFSFLLSLEISRAGISV